MEPLINYFKDIEIHHVLDVGTGGGGFIHVLKKTFPEAVITGVDPSEEALEAARNHFQDVTFRQMVAEKLDFEDDSFDVVSISMALHHLSKVQKGLKEIRRVVKPDGYIVVNEVISDGLTPAQEVHKLYHHFRSHIDRLMGRYHRKTFTKDAILQMLKVAELPVQFFFEQRRNVNLVEDEAELDLRIEKMKSMLEQIKGSAEYDVLQPQIEEFRSKALKYGFQPATNLILVLRKK
ncbi:Methyltransferase domain-containing protein [Mariniphaga anaerophila]|uniref:Methyltransferase domain-containing protein n=1 Tax=Mariniphaga anaerophila TaxID=1484053 RepID=A0A1M5CRR7_9BACT|nr:class I SAM-dependent methyltransferase [Mariniphaga anaerophila]SHF57430.1 Methyltransferase domain-containing protein [Mariniphaga anaerophila]